MTNDTSTPRRERYLERARELRAMAQAAKDPNVKVELLVLAQQYDKLADDIRRANLAASLARSRN